MPRITEQTKQSGMERVWLTVKRHQPNGVDTATIATLTGIQRRTVDNYLTFMKDEGKLEKDGKLWFTTDYEETRLLSVELFPEEAYTLYLGCRLLVKQHDKRNQLAEKALMQLADKLVTDAKVGTEIAQAAHELAKRPLDKLFQSHFHTMVQGYIQRRKVAIRYAPLNGKPFETVFRTYLIEPSAIGHTTYVIGHSGLPDALRAYKLERIESAELLKETYAVPQDFPGLEILRNSWSIMLGEGTVHVVVRFSPEVRKRVVETRWHPSEQLSEDSEKAGWLRWSVDVAETLDMEPWLRGWGNHCEVLEPQTLRWDMMGEARAMAMNYGWCVSTKPENEGNSSSTIDDFFGS